MNKLDTGLMHPKEQITYIIGKIYTGRLTTTSGGNVSIRDENGDIWVTPSAVDKGSLTENDIVCVKYDGTVSGLHKPSSEFPFHKAIYAVRPDIKAIIHAHPPGLVSFSIVRKIPNTNAIPQAKYVCGPIGYAPYALPGSETLGKEIANEFEKNYNAVIMENHGTVVGGYDLLDAFQRFETLEFCARTIVHGNRIGTPVYLSDEEIKAFEDHIPIHMPEMNEVYYPSEERNIRQEICKIVQRACNQGLMISTYGTVSVRWKQNDFLITPTNVNRWNISIEDIVQICQGEREPGKIPSRAVWLIAEIYKQNPQVNSIILTQSPYLMAFGVTGNRFDVRTIPESWIFLQDVLHVPFGSHFSGNETIPRLILNGSSAVFITNDSILVTGDELLQTFDRLEVAEFSAQSLVMSASLGEMKPITEQQLDDLRGKFLRKQK